MCVNECVFLRPTGVPVNNDTAIFTFKKRGRIPRYTEYMTIL